MAKKTRQTDNIIPIENAAPAPRYDWPESTEKRPLFVTLNPKELETSARKLADTVADIGRLQRDAKASATQWKARIEAVEAEQEHLSTIVREGREERNIECKWLYEAAGMDASSGEVIYHPEKKTLIRTDTYEVLEIRDITSDERQMSLLPPDENRDQEAASTAETGEQSTPPAESEAQA